MKNMIYITFINIRADENSELDEDGQGKMNLFKESKNKNKMCSCLNQNDAARPTAKYFCFAESSFTKILKINS